MFDDAASSIFGRPRVFSREISWGTGSGRPWSHSIGHLRRHGGASRARTCRMRFLVLRSQSSCSPSRCQARPVEKRRGRRDQRRLRSDLVPDNWNGSLFIYAHGYSADHRMITPFPADLTPGNFLSPREHAVPGDAHPDPDRLRVRHDHVPLGRLVREGLDQGHREPPPVLREEVRQAEAHVPLGALRRRHGDVHRDRVLPEHVRRRAADVRSGRRRVAGTSTARSICACSTSTCAPTSPTRVSRVASARTARAAASRTRDCPGRQTCGAVEPAGAARGRAQRGVHRVPADPSREVLGEPDPADWAATSSPRGHAPAWATSPTRRRRRRRSSPRRDLFVRATQIPQSFILTDMFFGTIGMGEVFHRRTNGKHAVGQHRRRLRVAAADRRRARRAERRHPSRRRRTPRAVRYMRSYYEPTGPHEIEGAHGARARRRARPGRERDQVPPGVRRRRRTRISSCSSTRLRRTLRVHQRDLPAVDALVAWVERDQKPTLASYRPTCPGLPVHRPAAGPVGTQGRRAGAARRTHALARLLGDEPNDCPPEQHVRREASLQARALSAAVGVSNEPCWDRTSDPQLKRLLLYQLS